MAKGLETEQQWLQSDHIVYRGGSTGALLVLSQVGVTPSQAWIQERIQAEQSHSVILSSPAVRVLSQ